MTNNQRLRLWLLLSFIGLLSAGSLYFSEIPLDNLPPEVLARIPAATLKWLIMINPAVLVITLTGIGVLCFDKVNLTAPLFEKIIDKNRVFKTSPAAILKYGLAGGILAGILLSFISLSFEPQLPEEFTKATKGPDLSIITKLMYGGIAEELMLRFGIMSVIMFALFKITRKLTVANYVIAIAISSFLFALGHFPVIYQFVNDPGPMIFAYVILGNCTGGIIFGWLYWKRGLESAILAHAVTHLVMTAATTL